MFDIVDLGVGNVRSVERWLARGLYDYRLIHHPKDIRAEHIILPGVGSARRFLNTLADAGFDDAIRSHVERGLSVVGICIGFQALATYTEEDGGCEGLGLLPGVVRRLPNDMSHNGWERLDLQRSQLPPHCGASKPKHHRRTVFSERLFFNHEYGYVPTGDEALSLPLPGFADCAAVAFNPHIIGIQCHPEKSQSGGANLLKFLF